MTLKLKKNIERFTLKSKYAEDQFSKELLVCQDIDTVEKREEILDLHGLRHKIMYKMQKTDENDRRSLKNFAGLVEHLEFSLQAAWGFSQDRNYHSWWFRVPHCNCPKKENMKLVGRERLVDVTCPVHENIP